MSRGNVELDALAAQRLGMAISRRRIAMGYKSARSLSRETGLDYRTITSIESGQPRFVDRNTLVTLEVTLNWPAGSIDKIINEVPLAEGRLIHVPEDIAEDIVRGAMAVAQAAFDMYISTLAER